MTHTPLRPVHSTGAEPGAASGAEPDERRVSRRPRWPWIAGGVLAVVAAGAGALALTGGNDQAAVNRPAANADGETIGKTNGGATKLWAGAAEGALAFTATRIECGVATVGSE